MSLLERSSRFGAPQAFLDHVDQRWVPPRYQRCGPSVVSASANATARSWMHRHAETDDGDAGPWLLLLGGDVGTGKTWLATAVFRCLVYACRLKNAIWLSADALWARYLALISTDEQAAAWLDEVTGCDLLLLDDLDLVPGDDSKRSHQMGVLLRSRYDAQRPTIVTTNMSRQQLARVDERLASRLFGDDTARVAMTGADRRGGLS